MIVMVDDEPESASVRITPAVFYLPFNPSLSERQDWVEAVWKRNRHERKQARLG